MNSQTTQNLELLKEMFPKRLLLTKAEVAKTLGISEAGLDRQRVAGKIKATKVGGLVQFNITEIAEAMAS